MTSNYERQRAVAELREASTGAYRHVDALDVIAGSVGVDVEGKFSHEIEKETYAALADLIDRPTCEMKSIPNSSHRVCSRCGAFVRKDAMTDCTGVIPVRHCPNCGAEVFAGAD